MPFIRPANGSKDGPVHFEWEATGRDGKPHDFYQEFRPGNEQKLPGPTAGRVARALLSVSHENAGLGLEVKIGLRELAGLCQLQKSGRTYDRIRRAIRRLHGLTIETNAFWNPEDKEYKDSCAIELLEYHNFKKEGRKIVAKVKWTPSAADLMDNWSRPPNLDHLFSMKSCIARKLYEISSLSIYRQGEMVEDLELLCHGQLGVSEGRSGPSRLKESLERPIDTLQENRFMAFKIQKSESAKSGWLVRARPMERMLELQSEIDDPQYWAFQLAARSMMASRDDSLEECRKWVDREGVSRARSAARKRDRPGGEGSPNEEATSTDCRRCPSEPSQGKSFQGKLSQETSSKGRERAVEEKISLYLRLIDPDEHGRLHRRARRYVDEKHPGLSGNRQRVLAHEAVGKIFLEREGPGSLPDPLCKQLG